LTNFVTYDKKTGDIVKCHMCIHIAGGK